MIVSIACWLADEMANSTAQWKVLRQQVMMGSLEDPNDDTSSEGPFWYTANEARELPFREM